MNLSIRKWVAFFVLLIINNVALSATVVSSKHTPVQPSQFLVLSDIHFDPFVACHNTTPCALINLLRELPAKQWDSLLTNMDTDAPQYHQDTNFVLLKSSLAEAKQIGDQQGAKFVLVLGDFLAHDYNTNFKKYSDDSSDTSYQDFVKKTFEFLTIELQQTFPNIDVYPLIGNNDSDQDDYVAIPKGHFYRNTGTVWSGLIKNLKNQHEMRDQFGYGAFYAVDFPGQSNMRLIVMNSLLLSKLAKGSGVSAAADEEMNWLHRELQFAKNKNQKALIVMHIPAGIDVFTSLKMPTFTIVEFWKSQYTQRFHDEIKQFAPNISGILAGHLHSDWFQSITFPDSSVEVPVIGTPSISPVHGNNPGFKIFTYSPSTQQLDDYVTYYDALDNSQAWNLEYTFSVIYNSNCHECPILSGIDQLKELGDLSGFYKTFYAVDNGSPPIAAQWSPYYWCAIHEMTPDDYQKCIA